MKRASSLAIYWLAIALWICAFGIVNDVSEEVAPYFLFTMTASVFLVGVDKIVLAIDKK